MNCYFCPCKYFLWEKGFKSIPQLFIVWHLTFHCTHVYMNEGDSLQKCRIWKKCTEFEEFSSRYQFFCIIYMSQVFFYFYILVLGHGHSNTFWCCTWNEKRESMNRSPKRSKGLSTRPTWCAGSLDSETCKNLKKENSVAPQSYKF